MSDESGKFTRGKQPAFPKLIMRAYTGRNEYVQWILTPPEGAGWFDYKFEAKQENGILYINFEHSIMTPKA